MPDTPPLDRPQLVSMLAPLAHRSRDPEAERLDSMEVAWLVHQVEQRYQLRLDLDDDQLAKMRTLTDAVALLNDSVVAGSG